MKGEPLCVSSNPGSGTCRDSLNVARTYLLIGFPKLRKILKLMQIAKNALLPYSSVEGVPKPNI